MIESIGSPTLWAGFTIFVVIMLALDLGLFHKSTHEVHFKEALAWVLVWLGLALLFNGAIWFWFGAQKALEFSTGYLIEYALSVDNLFVFLIILSYFSVPRRYQHRVIFWGILGAMVMRGVFIVAGSVLLQKFHALFYVFGAFLVFTGIKTIIDKGDKHDPSRNPVLRLFRRWIPITKDYHGSRFIVRENGKKYATPLLMVLVVIEMTDVIFAVDSVPAIFAVTHDPFIIYTSNIFAILGLRALYFVLSDFMGKLEYLKIGLGLVLTFVGIKMLIVEYYKIPIVISLGTIIGILGISVVASLVHRKKKRSITA